MIKVHPLSLIAALIALVLAAAIPIIVVTSIIYGGAAFTIPVFSLWGLCLLNTFISAFALVLSRRKKIRSRGQLFVLIASSISSTGFGLLFWPATTPLLIAGAVLALHPRPIERQAAQNFPDANLDGSTISGNFKQEKSWLKELNKGKLDKLQLPLHFYRSTDEILYAILAVVIMTAIVGLGIFLSTLGHQRPGSMQAMTISLSGVLLVFLTIALLVRRHIGRHGRPVVSLTQTGLMQRRGRKITTIAWHDITHLELRQVANGQSSYPFYFVCVRDPAKYGIRNSSLSPGSEHFARFMRGQRPEYYQTELPGVVLVVPLAWLGVEPAQFNALVLQCWQRAENVHN